jgi:hypothetical protein
VLLDEQPFIEHFEYARKSGFAMLSVADGDVRGEIYDDVEADKPWKTISLSNLLA